MSHRKLRIRYQKINGYLIIDADWGRPTLSNATSNQDIRVTHFPTSVHDLNVGESLAVRENLILAFDDEYASFDASAPHFPPSFLIQFDSYFMKIAAGLISRPLFQ